MLKNLWLLSLSFSVSAHDRQTPARCDCTLLAPDVMMNVADVSDLQLLFLQWVFIGFFMLVVYGLLISVPETLRGSRKRRGSSGVARHCGSE